MIYGAHQLLLVDDVTDRIGIRTVVYAQLWQASRWPLPLDEMDAESPAAPQVSGGMELIGRQTQKEGGALRTMWTYEGIIGSGKDVTFKTKQNSPDFRFEPGFSQVSILRHPKFRALKEEYQGDVFDGEVSWPDTITGNVSGHGLGQNTQGKNNPLFGVQTYLELEGTYTFRYASFSLGGVESGVARIFKGGLPGQAPSFPGRNWLKAPSPWQRRGPVFDITEFYWLSGAGGWPEAVYGRGPSEPGGSTSRGTNGLTGQPVFSAGVFQ